MHYFRFLTLLYLPNLYSNCIIFSVGRNFPVHPAQLLILQVRKTDALFCSNCSGDLRWKTHLKDQYSAPMIFHIIPEWHSATISLPLVKLNIWLESMTWALAPPKRGWRERGAEGAFALQVPKAPHVLFQCPIIGIKWWGHCLPISKHRCLRLPLGTSGIRAWISTMDSRSQWLASWLFSATCSPRLAEVLDCAGFDGLQEPEKGWQRHKMTHLLRCPTGQPLDVTAEHLKSG